MRALQRMGRRRHQTQITFEAIRPIPRLLQRRISRARRLSQLICRNGDPNRQLRAVLNIRYCIRRVHCHMYRFGLKRWPDFISLQRPH
jgi:hypothetical protein